MIELVAQATAPSGLTAPVVIAAIIALVGSVTAAGFTWNGNRANVRTNAEGELRNQTLEAMKQYVANLVNDNVAWRGIAESARAQCQQCEERELELEKQIDRLELKIEELEARLENSA